MTESNPQSPAHPLSGSAPASATAPIPDMLKTLEVDPLARLRRAQVEVARKQHGFNEVAAQKDHPLRQFLGKFWGLSAWMLELILVLSTVLRKYSDLVVVGTLLVLNAALMGKSIARQASSRHCGAG